MSGDRPGSGFELTPHDSTLGRTCMKWACDGELAPQDLQAILARLSQVDSQASTLLQCSMESD